MDSTEQYRTVSSPMKKNPKRKRVIGLRVSSDSTQGGRKYMEDVICIVFDREQDADYACFAVFDGHGGREAAVYARDHLWQNIKQQEGFFSREPDQVMDAIKEGFRETQDGMWKERPTWAKTLSGYPSTAGTTCSMVIICGTDMYVAHVGDSRIVMGVEQRQSPDVMSDTAIVAEKLTVDHKPGDTEELKRIENAGGQVLEKAGVQRVVWSRPRLDHQGPIRRNTELTDIPFLAVARSLGDLWSYNYNSKAYVVSPEPDVSHHIIDPDRERFLVLGSDGLWNMVTSEASVQIVEKYATTRMRKGDSGSETVSHQLIKRAMDLWNYHLLRADNISVITVFFEFPDFIEDEEDQIDLDAVKEWQNIGLTVQGEEVDENGDNFVRPALIRRHACSKLSSMENYNRLYCMSNKERRQYGNVPAPHYKRRYTDGLEVPQPKKQRVEPTHELAKPRQYPPEKVYKVIHTKSNIRVEYAYDVDKQMAKQMAKETPTKVKARRTFLTKSGPIEVLYECDPPSPAGKKKNAFSAPSKSGSNKTSRRVLSLDDSAVVGLGKGSPRLTRSAAKRSRVMSMHMTRAKRASLNGKFAEMHSLKNGVKQLVKMR
ncbi:protein phosphatase 1D-like [Diadema antillarum]|uniref:protein phosphatase 1D-like n=1 Tax=Diadema antillarum TaxID=105358 RepID=UPI003A86CB90